MRKTKACILKTLWILGVALLLQGTPADALADIFRWVDGDGVVHFTDNPENIPVKYRGKK